MGSGCHSIAIQCYPLEVYIRKSSWCILPTYIQLKQHESSLTSQMSHQDNAFLLFITLLLPTNTLTGNPRNVNGPHLLGDWFPS